jgi:hypothetical protein
VAATPEAKKKAGGMNLAKLKRALGVGGAVVKDLYIGLYGNPTEVMAGAKPGFMFAMDLGRISMFPRLFLPMAAKTLPPSRKPGEDSDMPVAFAFARNLVIAGDPKGIEEMIHTWKGTQMTVVTEKPAESEEATPEKKVQNLKFTSLGDSKGKVWKRVKKSLRDKATFSLALLVPNLIEQLKTDPQMQDAITQNSGKLGLSRVLGLVYSNQMDEAGLSVVTEVIFGWRLHCRQLSSAVE